MSDKIFLKEITFPILETGENETYSFVQTDDDLDTAGDAADAKAVGDEITSLKKDLQEFPNGNYPNMTAGNADQLVSTVFIEDEVPYNFRTSGGSADIGDREYDEIVGVSMPVNQLVDKNTLPATTTVNGVTYTNNGDGSITVTGTATDNSRLDNIIPIRTWLSHKYLLSGCPSGGSIQSYSLALRGQGADVFDFGNGVIWDASVNSYKGICIYVTSGTVNNLKFVPQFTDLTLTLGTQIADYVYGLETATAGSGVSWLKHHFPKIFDSGYIPYNAGEIQSVSGLSVHRMTGFNQFNASTITDNAYIGSTGDMVTNQSEFFCSDYIQVVPNTVYYSNTDVNGRIYTHLFYDANKNYVDRNSTSNSVFTTPQNACYMRVNAIKSKISASNICINLHWDGERDGEYEAYKEYVYPLDDSVVLRGKLELDSNNNLRANGDRYLPDGTVTHYWKEETYDGSEAWVKDTNRSGYYRFYVRDDSVKTMTDYRGQIINSRGYGTANGYGLAYDPTDNVLVTAYNIRGSINWIYIAVKESMNISTVDAFKAWLAQNPVTLVLQLATPTTESAEPYTSPQIVDDWGTEEYVSTSLVPVGHDTKYANNLRAKLEMSPASPEENGDYIVRHSNGENEYVALGSTTTIQNILDRLTALENA